VPGAAQIFQITKHGKIVDTNHGLTAITGLALDGNDNLFVLELSTASDFPVPGTGKVVRLHESGAIEEIVTGLVLPTGNMALTRMALSMCRTSVPSPCQGPDKSCGLR